MWQAIVLPVVWFLPVLTVFVQTAWVAARRRTLPADKVFAVKVSAGLIVTYHSVIWLSAVAAFSLGTALTGNVPALFVFALVPYAIAGVALLWRSEAALSLYSRPFSRLLSESRQALLRTDPVRNACRLRLRLLGIWSFVLAGCLVAYTQLPPGT